MESARDSRMTLGRWSVFVGANQSKLVDLLVRNALNVCLVVGIVCLSRRRRTRRFVLIGAALRCSPCC